MIFSFSGTAFLLSKVLKLFKSFPPTDFLGRKWACLPVSSPLVQIWKGEKVGAEQS